MKQTANIVLPVAAACLASCSGTFGTIVSKTWHGEGTEITEIRSYGIQLRNLPSYCGISLGNHHSVYAARSPGSSPTPQSESPPKYGLCPGPAESPVYLGEAICGIEIAASPVFAGVSAGFNTRAIAMLSVDGNETLSVIPAYHGTIINHYSKP